MFPDPKIKQLMFAAVRSRAETGPVLTLLIFTLPALPLMARVPLPAVTPASTSSATIDTISRVPLPIWRALRVFTGAGENIRTSESPLFSTRLRVVEYTLTRGTPIIGVSSAVVRMVRWSFSLVKLISFATSGGHTKTAHPAESGRA